MHFFKEAFEHTKELVVRDYKHAHTLLNSLHLKQHVKNFFTTERIPRPHEKIQLSKPPLLESKKWAKPFLSVIKDSKLGFEHLLHAIDSKKLHTALKEQNFGAEKTSWRQMQLHCNSVFKDDKLAPFLISFYLGLLMADFSQPEAFPQNDANYLPLNLSIPTSLTFDEHNDKVNIDFTDFNSHDFQTKEHVTSLSQLFKLVSLNPESQKRVLLYCDSLLGLIRIILMQKHDIMKRHNADILDYSRHLQAINGTQNPNSPFPQQNPYLMQIFEDLRDFETIITQLKENFISPDITGNDNNISQGGQIYNPPQNPISNSMQNSIQGNMIRSNKTNQEQGYYAPLYNNQLENSQVAQHEQTTNNSTIASSTSSNNDSQGQNTSAQSDQSTNQPAPNKNYVSY